MSFWDCLVCCTPSILRSAISAWGSSLCRCVSFFFSLSFLSTNRSPSLAPGAGAFTRQDSDKPSGIFGYNLMPLRVNPDDASYPWSTRTGCATSPRKIVSCNAACNFHFFFSSYASPSVRLCMQWTETFPFVVPSSRALDDTHFCHVNFRHFPEGSV